MVPSGNYNVKGARRERRERRKNSAPFAPFSLPSDRLDAAAVDLATSRHWRQVGVADGHLKMSYLALHATSIVRSEVFTADAPNEPLLAAALAIDTASLDLSSTS